MSKSGPAQSVSERLLVSLPDRLAHTSYLETPSGRRVPVTPFNRLPVAHAAAQWVVHYQRAIWELGNSIDDVAGATGGRVPRTAVVAYANHRYNLGSALLQLADWCDEHEILPGQVPPVNGQRMDAFVTPSGETRNIYTAQEWRDEALAIQAEAQQFLPEIEVPVAGAAPSPMKGFPALPPAAISAVYVGVTIALTALALRYILPAGIADMATVVTPLAASAAETARTLRESYERELTRCEEIDDATQRAACQQRASDTFLTQIDQQNRVLAQHSTSSTIRYVVFGAIAVGVLLVVNQGVKIRREYL